jgi:hypothetical protein
VTGWSTAPRADWYVTVEYADTFQGGFTPSFSRGVKTTTVNNGKTATLSLTTPSAPGAFAVFLLTSSESPPDPMTGFIPQPQTGDCKHVWAFGVRPRARAASPRRRAATASATPP